MLAFILKTVTTAICFLMLLNPAVLLKTLILYGLIALINIVMLSGSHYLFVCG